MTTARWQPAFEDTFSGTALDTSVRNDQRREHESVYAPRTCARVGLPCSYTSRGTPGTSSYLLNSQVATDYTRHLRHGIVAARIKPQRAKGMHSGFWLLPRGTTSTTARPKPSPHCRSTSCCPT